MTDKQKYIWYPFLTALAAAIFGGAIAKSIYDLWPSFWVFIGVLFYIGGAIWLVLFVHNLFYHATFLMIGFFFQYVTNKYNDALITLSKVIKVRPNDVFPLLQLANIYIERKEFPSAQNILNRALSLVGERSDVLETQMILFWNWGKWEQVTITIKKILRASPNRVDLRQDLLVAYFYLGRYQQGIKELNELITGLLDSAKSFEAKSQFPSARRKLWTAVNAQQKAMTLLGDALSELQVSNNNETDKNAQLKLEQLIVAVKKGLASADFKDFSLYLRSADLCFSLGRYHLGVELLHKVGKTLAERVKSFEAQSLYETARKKLWKFIGFQTDVIQLMSKNLTSHKLLSDLQNIKIGAG